MKKIFAILSLLMVFAAASPVFAAPPPPPPHHGGGHYVSAGHHRGHRPPPPPRYSHHSGISIYTGMSTPGYYYPQYYDDFCYRPRRVSYPYINTGFVIRF